MNILPKKSWHVRNKDNIARVRRDETRAAEEEREIQRRVERAEQEARTEYLRTKSRATLGHGGGKSEEGEQRDATQHLNLFPLEESSEKRGNEEYQREKREEKEKQERSIGLLVSLGPAPGTEVTPWYLKSREEREVEEREKKEKGKKKCFTDEEREKKDRKLKDSMDPLKDIKKALAVKEKKHKKKEKKDRGEKRGGESSIERLRTERLQREVEERRRAQELLDQRNGKRKERDEEKEMDDRERPYNSAYFPKLARKRQRRDREQYGF